ncbi:unnamed protein product [Nippostrongylus brasiliensis]|uniref:FMRFamide n=1 Tax=Nippostrongylus brasiliensis TaxID=27835 RepID=A0A158R1R4_NIPBR|nr:unnamed protein product [Nippostrongylus brasiliensis]
MWCAVFFLSLIACTFAGNEEHLAEQFCPAPMMEKRKSAFVRFGKRSDEDVMDVDKRKSAFVRFGRSAPLDMPEKRKSQYIRFGRK